MTTRMRILLACLLIVVVAALWPQADQPVSEAGKKRSPSSGSDTAQPLDPAANPASAPTQRLAQASANLFAPRVQQAPITTAIKKRSEPVTPPLPVTFVGRWRDQGSESVFVAYGDDVIKAKTGDVIGQSWRLDRIETNQLIFTYLPTRTTQTMRIAP